MNSEQVIDLLEKQNKEIKGISGLGAFTTYMGLNKNKLDVRMKISTEQLLKNKDSIPVCEDDYELIPYLIFCKKREEDFSNKDFIKNEETKEKISKMVGNVYQHYKNKREYIVIGKVFDTLFDRYKVLYVNVPHTPDSELYERSYERFLSEVEVEGIKVPRFKFIRTKKV